MYKDDSINYDKPRDLTKLEWVFLISFIVICSVALGGLIFTALDRDKTTEPYSLQRRQYIDVCAKGEESLVIRNDLGTAVLTCKK